MALLIRIPHTQTCAPKRRNCDVISENTNPWPSVNFADVAVVAGTIGNKRRKNIRPLNAVIQSHPVAPIDTGKNWIEVHRITENLLNL
jgi:hypothetical protein